MNPEQLEIIAAARQLLDCVTYDSDGVMVGSMRQGGNGGLLSRDSLKAADRLRKALDHVDRAARSSS